MLELATQPEAWLSLLVLSLMEIILGVDNIVFITILCGRLPPAVQLRGRRIGLSVALISRLGLLFSINWVMTLEEPLFELIRVWTGKDLILLVGGLFLLYKATHEIYENVERPAEHQPSGAAPGMAESSVKHGAGPFVGIMLQVMLLDIVFSLDSVITAVGMAEEVAIMAAAMLIAVGVMVAFAGPIGDFIQEHPSVKILALSFLVLIGVMLIAESTGQHLPKGYIYASMGFSLAVQMLNVRMHSRVARAREHPGIPVP